MYAWLKGYGVDLADEGDRHPVCLEELLVHDHVVHPLLERWI